MIYFEVIPDQVEDLDVPALDKVIDKLADVAAGILAVAAPADLRACEIVLRQALADLHAIRC